MEYSTPKGMKDYLPKQMLLREDLLDRIRATFRLYGFAPLDTPAIESLATLQKKGGDEIEGQIFRIEGDLGLRFDLTVPLARVCGSNTFSLPFKRYAISKVWRREEPQKGRLREFVQADIDIVGSSSPRCEAELLACASDALISLGFEKFEIRLNSRELLESYFEKSGIAQKDRRAVMRALDKIGKLPEEKIAGMLEEILGSDKGAKGLLEFINTKGNQKVLGLAKKMGLAGADNLEKILTECKAFGISAVLDCSLVRGLDYYTGAVFEISAGSEIGSVAGGGRYDNLIGQYGTSQPAVGISLGFERLFALIEAGKANIDKRLSGGTGKVFVACTDDKYYPDAIKCAKILRDAGISCTTDVLGRKFGKQVEYAGKEGFSYLVILGEKEAAEKSASVKDLKTGKQQTVKLDKLTELFSN